VCSKMEAFSALVTCFALCLLPFAFFSPQCFVFVAKVYWNVEDCLLVEVSSDLRKSLWEERGSKDHASEGNRVFKFLMQLVILILQ
jgi:hypothetical protein